MQNDLGFREIVIRKMETAGTSQSKAEEVQDQQEQVQQQRQSSEEENKFLLKNTFKNITFRASLVAQWLRIHLTMQGTRVRALVQEDPTCHGATKPMRHNY